MTQPAEAIHSDQILRDLRTGLEEFHAQTEDALTTFGYDDGAKFAIRLAIEEAVVNAFRHGNRSDPSKTVRCCSSIGSSSAAFEVEDQGPGFDPAKVPDPTVDENLEIPSGRGVMLIKAYMTEVEYLPPGNRLRMVYRKPAAAAS